MNRNKALVLLGADDSVDSATLVEKLEDEVFNLATYFLKRAFLPKLAEIKKLKLKELWQAGELLSLNPVSPVPKFEVNSLKPVTQIISLSELLRDYHETESAIKTSLANATRADFALIVYSEWIRVFNSFAERFKWLYEKSAYFNLPDKTIKLSEPIDIMQVVNELEGDKGIKVELHKYYSWLCKV